jgi:hypothetical protein
MPQHNYALMRRGDGDVDLSYSTRKIVDALSGFAVIVTKSTMPAAGAGHRTRQPHRQQSSPRRARCSCFPKDTVALIKAAQDAEALLRILETVAAVNDTRKRGMARKVASEAGNTAIGPRLTAYGWSPEAVRRDLDAATVVAASFGTAALIWSGGFWEERTLASRCKLAHLWSALVVVGFAGEGHNDSILIVFVLASLVCAGGRPAVSVAALSLGVMVKDLPVMVAPALLTCLWRSPPDFHRALHLRRSSSDPLPAPVGRANDVAGAPDGRPTDQFGVSGGSGQLVHAHAVAVRVRPSHARPRHRSCHGVHVVGEPSRARHCGSRSCSWPHQIPGHGTWPCRWPSSPQPAPKNRCGSRSSLACVYN